MPNGPIQGRKDIIMSSKTVKFSTRNSTRTAIVTLFDHEMYVTVQDKFGRNKKLYAPVYYATELAKEWKMPVEYQFIDDGLEVEGLDVLDPKMCLSVDHIGLSPLDKELYASWDHRVQLGLKWDGSIGISKIVARRNPEVRGGTAKSKTISAYESDPVAYAWAVDHEELWDDQPSEEDVLAHVAESYTDGQIQEDDEEFELDEMDDSLAHGDTWDVIFHVEATEEVCWDEDETGKLVKTVTPGAKVEKSAPLYWAPRYQKPLKGEAIGIMRAIELGNISKPRQLYLACQRVDSFSASKLWNAFKVVRHMRLMEQYVRDHAE